MIIMYTFLMEWKEGKKTKRESIKSYHHFFVGFQSEQFTHWECKLKMNLNGNKEAKEKKMLFLTNRNHNWMNQCETCLALFCLFSLSFSYTEDRNEGEPNQVKSKAHILRTWENLNKDFISLSRVFFPTSSSPAVNRFFSSLVLAKESRTIISQAYTHTHTQTDSHNNVELND